MKNIVFIAPPAAGKGTQSDLLVKKYGYKHISTGDLLRNEIATGSKLGEHIAELIKQGAFVSDDIVISLLKVALDSMSNEDRFILDGFPRNTHQAECLNGILENGTRKVDVALYLNMDTDTAMHRALGRVTCPKCKKTYNRYEESLKPKVEMVCDDCGETLVGRTDDNEETFKSRFENYVRETEPLLKFYENEGLLRRIDNSGTPEETFKKIEEVI